MRTRAPTPMNSRERSGGFDLEASTKLPLESFARVVVARSLLHSAERPPSQWTSALARHQTALSKRQIWTVDETLQSLLNLLTPGSGSQVWADRGADKDVPHSPNRDVRSALPADYGPLKLAKKMTSSRATQGLLSSCLIALQAVTLLAVYGCGTDVEKRLQEALSAGESKGDGGASAGGKSDGNAAMPNASAAWRYIAVVSKTPQEPCPTPLAADWQTAPLFRQGPSALLSEGQLLPAPLERFCEYTWTQAPKKANAAPSFSDADTAKIVRIDADRDIVVPQAPPTSAVTEKSAIEATLVGHPQPLQRRHYFGGQSDVRAALVGAYHGQAGADPVAGAVPKEVEGAPVIAVIDSVGYDDSNANYGRSPARMQHGLAMAALIRDIRCPDGEAGCKGRLFHAQAFPYTAENPMSTPAGGPLGSLGSLARALGESVLRWRKMPVSRGPLVVNLSLGWDPQLADLSIPAKDHVNLLAGDVTTVPATVQAVHAGLVWAACNQALVIAAAGNNDGEPCEGTGPLAPAAWERLPSVRPSACAAIFGKDQVVSRKPEGSGGSLVYAAGGLTYIDKPLPNMRVGSMPGRALPALQAVAEGIPGRSDGWTGSSVAAATLSAISARAWSIDLQRSPHEITARIDASGKKLDFESELYRSGQKGEPVRRIIAHDAVAAICAASGQGKTCANPYAELTLANINKDVGEAFRLHSAAKLSGLDRIRKSVDLECTTRELICPNEQVVELRDCRPKAATIATVSLSAQVLSQPWIRPQPDVPICPVCPVNKGKGNLYISLNPNSMPATGSVIIGDPLLRFALADGSWVQAQLEDIEVGSTTVIVDLSGYRVVVAGATTTVAELLVDEQVSVGELVFTVPDATGNPTTMTSVLSID